jgi:uncharacterized membrane protein SpoIIM required for sporulation
MSFTPDRSSNKEIAPFELLQESFSQAMPIYLPLVILATPSLAVAILDALVPSLKGPLAILNSFVVTPLVSGASIYLAYRYLSTQTSDLGGAFTEALGKIAQLIVGFLLYAIAVFVGLFLLIVPGIYVAIRLGFVMYGIMIDDLSAVDSLKSSWELVGGRWGSVFVAQLVPAICFIVPVLVIAALIGAILGPKAVAIASIFGALVGLAATPFLVTYYTKLYLRLQGSDD